MFIHLAVVSNFVQLARHAYIYNAVGKSPAIVSSALISHSPHDELGADMVKLHVVIEII